MYVSPVSDYNSTVQILKNRSLLFEAKEEVDDSFKYSDDSLRRAIDIELEAAGLMSHQSVSGEDQAKAKKKAIENLKKDPLHYYHLIAGESSKVDKHDKEAETKRGAGDVDTFNGLKKATLKEGHPKHADGTPKSNAEMTDDEKNNFYDDLDSVDEKNYANFTAKKIKSDFKYATDSDIGGIDTSLDPYEDRKEIISQVVQLIKSSMPADNGTIKDFIRTHYDDIINLGDDEAILDEFQEFLSKGKVDEKKGTDHDKDGDIDGDDYKHAKDKAIKKAMGKDEIVKENLKAIISKVLEEQVIAEAATAQLSKLGDDYEGFDGMKASINGLENIVTDIEQYFDKTRQKIQKIYDTLGEIRNEEGLKVGGFLAPAIEQAFIKDLKPAISQGFTKGLNQPKVKTVSKANYPMSDIEEGPEEPKQTVFTPVNESKKKKQ